MSINVEIRADAPKSLHQVVEAALAAIGARGLSARITLSVPKTWRRPVPFPAYRVLSVRPSDGLRNISVGAWNLLAALSDSNSIKVRVFPDDEVNTKTGGGNAHAHTIAAHGEGLGHGIPGDHQRR